MLMKLMVVKEATPSLVARASTCSMEELDMTRSTVALRMTNSLETMAMTLSTVKPDRMSSKEA
jgi:hypothetical protein